MFEQRKLKGGQDTPETEAELGHGAPTLPPQPEPVPLPEALRLAYVGTLGPASMALTLQRSGATLTGSCRTGRHGTLTLHGTLDHSGTTLKVEARDPRGKLAGELRLTVRGQNLHGVWRPQGKGSSAGVHLRNTSRPTPAPPSPLAQPGQNPAQPAREKGDHRADEPLRLGGKLGRRGLSLALTVGAGRVSGEYRVGKGAGAVKLSGTLGAGGQLTLTGPDGERLTGTLDVASQTLSGVWTAGGRAQPLSLTGAEA